MNRRLIVNADDYGRTLRVSRGILEAHRRGIVTSTTVMVNQPGVEPQLAEALLCPGLGIGLHLVFTAWRPVLPPADVPGLVDQGGFFLDQHTVWAQAETIPVSQLRSELSAQVERFRRLAGRLPDHLDCHHFVHLYPPFFQVYADLAFVHGLPLRVPFQPETEFLRAAKSLPFLEGFPRDLVRGMIATDSALLRARHLAHPDHFVGSFYGREALSLDGLVALLGALPVGTSELMCHPGYADDDLGSSVYRQEREVELALLTHPAIVACIQEQEIELVTFGALRQT
jgi:predicted glycoside hydrolase/deacetylase ChbG (UPF0249 family)